MLEWVGGSFDPEAFDLAAVNRALVAEPKSRMELAVNVAFALLRSASVPE